MGIRVTSHHQFLLSRYPWNRDEAESSSLHSVVTIKDPDRLFSYTHTFNVNTHTPTPIPTHTHIQIHTHPHTPTHKQIHTHTHYKAEPQVPDSEEEVCGVSLGATGLEGPTSSRVSGQHNNHNRQTTLWGGGGGRE